MNYPQMSVLTNQPSVLNFWHIISNTLVFQTERLVNRHVADIPEEMSVKNMHVTCQSATLYKSLAMYFCFSKKCEMGIPINIRSHVEVVEVTSKLLLKLLVRSVMQSTRVAFL
jgi:hypothetical protein